MIQGFHSITFLKKIGPFECSALTRNRLIFLSNIISHPYDNGTWRMLLCH
jgi:hypothetical protein